MQRNNIPVTQQALACIDLFSDLPAMDRKHIADMCRCVIYEKNDLIVSRKNHDNCVYFILSGNVRITTYSSSGREITFRDQHAGEVFGELSAIDNEPRSADVLALCESMIATVSAVTFLELVGRYPSVTKKILIRLTRLVRLLSERIIEYSSLGVKYRIHAELLRLANEVGHGKKSVEISPAPTHLEIANRISTHREAVTRELRELVTAGLLCKRKNCLMITDLSKLEKMVVHPDRPADCNSG